MTTLNVPIQLRRGLEAGCPSVMLAGEVYVCLDSGKLFAGTGTGKVQVGGSNGAVWGAITGTLSDQTDLQTALGVLATAIVAETNRAENVEGTIEASVTSEATTRASADTTLQGNITAEASTRATADTNNATAITTEVSRAEAAEASLAPQASPTLTGTVTIPTPSTSDNSTKAASTAFVKAQGYLTSAPVTSVAGKTGTVTLVEGDVANLTTDLAATEKSANKDTASGYAGLTAGGLLKTAEMPAFTGDITTTAGTVATTLKNTGTAGTYPKVTTDAQGRVTVGAALTPSDLPLADAVGSASFSAANSSTTGAVTASLVTIAQAIAKGQCVLVAVQQSNATAVSGVTVWQVYDDGGNFYANIGGLFTSTIGISQLFICLNARNAATTIFARCNATAASMQVGVHVSSGVASVKMTNLTSGNNGATTAGTISLNPTQANSLMVAFFMWYKSGTNVTVAANAGNLRSSVTSVSTANSCGVAVVDNTQAGLTSETCSVTASATPTGWINIAVELIHN